VTSLEVGLQLAALTPHLCAVALCAARLLPVVFLCPVLGGSAAPTPVKLGVVLALSLCLHFGGGVVPTVPVVDPLTFTGLVIREFSFGMALGLVASLPFDAARMGGRLVDLFRGSSAEAALPYAGTRESATGDALYQLVVALVVVGPMMPLMLVGLFHSYAVVRLGAFVHTESAALYLAALAGTALGAGLAVGAPIAAAAMAVDCVMGLMSRAAPQMNLQEVGSPLKILAGGAVLLLGLGVIAERLLGEVAKTPGQLSALTELSR
jgi:flagellar biosynthetic protein FliR/type III secretion protein T